MSRLGSLSTVLSIGAVACFVALRPSPPAANGASPHHVPRVAAPDTDWGLDEHLGTPRGPVDDCNRNGIPDDQDIAGGTSQDCNANLQPDECDVGPILAFEIGEHVAAQENPTYAVAVDLDNDGDIDLAVSDAPKDPLEGAIVLTVLRNIGDGSFAPMESYPVADDGSPEEIVAGDFNSDGWIDVAVAGGNNGHINVLLNLGDGTFGPAVTYFTGATIYSLTTGDMDSDGDIDLVGADYGHHKVAILFNNGDGTFALPHSFPTGDQPGVVVAGDFDDDGDLDLATMGISPRQLSVLFNNGDGTWDDPIAFAVPELAYRLLAEDMNDDGRIDLVVGNAGSGYLSVFLNDGTGHFWVTTFEAVGDVQLMRSADFDSDGDPDIVTFSIITDDVVVYLNDGRGRMDDHRTIATGLDEPPSGGYGVAVGDFNLDGKPDVAAVSNQTKTIAILLNRTFTGHYSGDCDANGIPDFCDIKAGDLSDCNGDGIADVCDADCNGDGIADVCDTADHALQDCNANQIPDACDLRGQFGLLGEALYPIGATPASVVLADFNGDGASDLAGAPGEDGLTYVLLNTVDGFFATGTPVSVLPAGTYLTSADLDGDGDMDLAGVSEIESVLYVHLNDGDATFAEPATYDVQSDTSLAIVAVDLDADGYPDLVTANGYSHTLSVFMNHGDGTFADAQLVFLELAPESMAVADLDGDGDADIAVNAGGNSGRIIPLLNDGNGSLVAGQESDLDSSSASVAAGDLDGDGDVDLVVAATYISSSFNNPSGGISVALNNGDATFGPPAIFSLGSQQVVVGVVDLDADGDLDIVSVGEGVFDQSGRLSVLINYGNAEFWLRESLPVDGEPRGLAFGDFDNDVYSDLAIGSAERGALSVMRNATALPLSNDCNVNDMPDECEIDVCPGDVNGDCTIDPLDLGNVLSHFGCLVGVGDPDCDAADVNGDALVDPLDSGFVLSRFGSCPAG